MKASVAPDPKTTMTPSWDLVKPSYQLVLKNFEPIIFLYFLPALVVILANLLLGNSLQQQHHVFTQRERIGLYVYIASVIWSAINSGPSIIFQLKAASGKSPTLAQAYRQGLRYSLPIVGFYIIFFVLVIIGLALLVVPGFIIFRRYLLTPYYMVDQKLPIVQAMKLSAEQTKPVNGFIWGTIGVEIVFVFAAVLFQVIPLIGAVIGQLVSYVILFLFVLRYRQVSSASKA